MRRYLSLNKSSRPASGWATQEEYSEKPSKSRARGPVLDDDDNESTTALVPAPVTAPLNLKVKRVDHYYSNWAKAWKYRNSGSKVTPDMSRPAGIALGSDANDPWQAFCFVVVRKIPRGSSDGNPNADPTFVVVVKSPYLAMACKDVIQDVPGLSWTAEPLELDPQLLLGFLPHFVQYQGKLRGKRDRTPEETNILATVDVLLEYLNKDYRGTIATIANLTSHSEITFDLLYSIFVPRTVLITQCASTGAPRALQLVSVLRQHGVYNLVCESVDVHETGPTAPPPGNWQMQELATRDEGEVKVFGRVQNRVIVSSFKGTKKIHELDVYPIKYHPAEADLRKALLERGKKWHGLSGVHHMHYAGTGVFMRSVNSEKKCIRYAINSRIMIDRTNFRKFNPNYDLPITKADAPVSDVLPEWDGSTPSRPPPIPSTSNIPTLGVMAKSEDKELSEEELLITSPIVYGFSLADKLWLEFSIEQVHPVTWNDEAFANLVLPAGRKTLLQSLVEAHNTNLGFDDFVKGKGHGLVINMFGPPGVGKTLSAEATSEHVRRPLYVVGCGDLGTTASQLDEELEKVFDLATAWKAIILIDEADVFLERRSLHDLERNAMVAVFLRHVEYYCGILFLTTNRVQTFDEAFLSRIHVGLHFQELTKPAKMQVWRAFLSKVGAHIDEALLERLAERDINGRQIKNATRTANSLAAGRREPLAFGHLTETLDAMEEFAAEFAAVKATA
ncbi:P-loop containing nucleoside triphosphate hydrolase protein [Amylocystis lapponica]|nr:P-loop containing nucleoside triphosphate hydrolase protein [Amylocystis lapponica]